MGFLVDGVKKYHSPAEKAKRKARRKAEANKPENKKKRAKAQAERAKLKIIADKNRKASGKKKTNLKIRRGFGKNFV